MEESGEDTVVRFTEYGVTITAMMWRHADTDHTRYGIATHADGRFIGSYHPTDIHRQTGWLVTTPTGPHPIPVADEPRAVQFLIAHAERAGKA